MERRWHGYREQSANQIRSRHPRDRRDADGTKPLGPEYLPTARFAAPRLAATDRVQYFAREAPCEYHIDCRCTLLALRHQLLVTSLTASPSTCRWSRRVDPVQVKADVVHTFSTDAVSYLATARLAHALGLCDHSTDGESIVHRDRFPSYRYNHLLLVISRDHNNVYLTATLPEPFLSYSPTRVLQSPRQWQENTIDNTDGVSLRPRPG